MTANKPSTAAAWTDPDDAPDLSTPEYQAKLAATRVRRGRPKVVARKVHINFRLSADVAAAVKASGRGYNVRVEKALRAAGFGAEAAAPPEGPPAAVKKRRAGPAVKES
jgi:uncharacterized protein (DUF4415 family)